MSVALRSGEKIVLPRLGRDEFWKLLMHQISTDEPRQWKYLAMLSLYEHGWPLSCIGKVFGHQKGTISRYLARIKQDLQHVFELPPSTTEKP